MSSESSCLISTPRSSYNTASTYRLSVDFWNQVEEVNEGEVEELCREGAIFVSELNDNDRTPTRDNFGGSEGNEGGGQEGAAAIIPQRVTAGSGRVNGASNMNPPHGPRRGGNVGGQNRGRGGRSARIWNWHNSSR
ncbi:ac971751-09b6-46d2-bee2-58b2d394ae5e [Sclerotinia trifoliorum]|uniref:Ac971751-09b6-46d2-bee2-58b2d394ae5e n=1 Tax=Sclerotinia trifoliorum TaxID=28548 RepID=A0A8H2VMS1_9HELO|nr:ac971751-09b6-46d2-bee2-58b2d394ae5e [Sclerotinia trifoliorum]